MSTVKRPLAKKAKKPAAKKAPRKVAKKASRKPATKKAAGGPMGWAPPAAPPPGKVGKRGGAK